MLTETVFMEKRHILMDKATMTVIMNRRDDGEWLCITIDKDVQYYNDDDYVDIIGKSINCQFLHDHYAYKYYVERMESFGFKPFTIIVE